MKKAVLASLVLGVLFTSCTRPLVTGRDYKMEPLSQTFNAAKVAVVEAAEMALTSLDYKVEYVNADDGALRTGWRPTTIDSHYLELFGRQDYGANGAYYHMTIRIESVAPSVSKVIVATPIRSIVAKMKTSHRLEKKFLAKLGDMLRPADIDVTNIGVMEKTRPITEPQP